MPKPPAAPDISFTLPLDDVNKIMLALAQRPFVEVADLIAEMQRQAGPQLPPRDPLGIPVVSPPEKVNGEVPGGHA